MAGLTLPISYHTLISQHGCAETALKCLFIISRTAHCQPYQSWSHQDAVLLP
ncbi:hypothetical protein ACO0LC_22040 [Undibacterium sp. JH2W]|uniref:hypothetical protein n=1 Tax=Undibacterium sp. JH2W TaxID=3413037 RepID=UPI003BF3192A